MVKRIIVHFILTLFLRNMTVIGHLATSTTTVEEVLTEISGVYTNKVKSAKFGLEKTILVTGGNYGYLDFTLNFHCFIQKLGIKMLFLAMDKQVFDAIQPGPNLQKLYFQYGYELKGGTSKFRKGDFNEISFRKLKSVLQIMKLGYDVLFFDTDIILLEDPVPFMIIQDFDYIHQRNCGCPCSDKDGVYEPFWQEGNTGIYYARATPAIIYLWEQVIASEKSFGNVDDQTVFWNVVHQMLNPQYKYAQDCNSTSILQTFPPEHIESLHHTAPAIHFEHHANMSVQGCPLDSCRFSAGMLVNDNTEFTLRTELTRRGIRPIALHFNWIDGHDRKKDKIRRNSLWLLNDSDGSLPSGTCLNSTVNWF